MPVDSPMVAISEMRRRRAIILLVFCMAERTDMISFSVTSSAESEMVTIKWKHNKF